MAAFPISLHRFFRRLLYPRKKTLAATQSSVKDNVSGARGLEKTVEQDAVLL
jgi:hypothetical protein